MLLLMKRKDEEKTETLYLTKNKIIMEMEDKKNKKGKTFYITKSEALKWCIENDIDNNIINEYLN